MNYRFQKRAIVFSFFILFNSCKNQPEKKDLFSVNKICDNLYREKFNIFSGGAYSAEIYEDYLTDSTNFRILIGTHFENQYISYECIGDTIFVKKFGTPGKTREDSSFIKKFSLALLKKERRMD